MHNIVNRVRYLQKFFLHALWLFNLPSFTPNVWFLIQCLTVNSGFLCLWALTRVASGLRVEFLSGRRDGWPGVSGEGLSMSTRLNGPCGVLLTLACHAVSNMRALDLPAPGPVRVAPAPRPHGPLALSGSPGTPPLTHEQSVGPPPGQRPGRGGAAPRAASGPALPAPAGSVLGSRRGPSSAWLRPRFSPAFPGPAHNEGSV